MSNKTPRKTGTREWSDYSYNIGYGCSHDCLYCYAKAKEYKKSPDAFGWSCESIKKTFPSTSKKDGIIMFPTTHDITPYYLPYAIESLKKLLKNGNNVLIVTKPHMKCVVEMCKELEPWKSNMLFRFTIGTLVDAQAKFWEPGAPSIPERIECLMYAFDCGYATSVSMEPMLGSVEDTIDSINVMEQYVTDKIWIGKMNKIDERVVKSSVEITYACDEIIKQQSDENILRMVEQLKDNPKIAWKDSILEVIERNK